MIATFKDRVSNVLYDLDNGTDHVAKLVRIARHEGDRQNYKECEEFLKNAMANLQTIESRLRHSLSVVAEALK